MAEDDNDDHQEPDIVTAPGEPLPTCQEECPEALEAEQPVDLKIICSPPRTPTQVKGYQLPNHHSKVSSMDLHFWTNGTNGGRLNLNLMTDLPSRGNNASVTPNSVGSPVQVRRSACVGCF